MQFAAYAMPSYCEELRLSQGEMLSATLEHLVLAETLGFDSVWVNEHHFHQYGGLMPSLPTMLAALSQRTSRVRLGTSVVVLPLHNPLEIAEQLAMVDLLSGGRLDVGVGRGFVAHDYETLGVNYEDAQQRLIESLDVLRSAWSGETFTHHGTYYQYDNLCVWPAPHQRPHPPIWMAASRSPKSFEWAARHDHNLLTIGYISPITALAELTRIYRDVWAEGHPGVAPTIATHYHVVVAESRGEARKIAERGLTEHIRLNQASRSLAKIPLPAPSESLSVGTLVDEGRLIAGDPDDCVAMLQRMASEIGGTETHCLFQFGNISFDAARRSMELFAAEVMPRLRDEP